MRHNQANQIVVYVADNLITRFLGLAAKDALHGAEALLLKPCKSIHTFGMKQSIDVAFLDTQGTVIKSAVALRRNQLISCWSAKTVLERFSDEDSGWFEVGDHVNWNLLREG